MNCRPSLILILMILFSPLIQAQTQDDDTPSLDLLEFLGEWETSDGTWLDPAQLEDNDFARLMSLTGKEKEEDE